MPEPQATVVITLYNSDGTITCTTWFVDRPAGEYELRSQRARHGPPTQQAIVPLDEVRKHRSELDWSRIVFDGDPS